MTATFFTIDGGAYLTTQSHDEILRSLDALPGEWVEMAPSGTLVNLAHVVAIEMGPGEEQELHVFSEGKQVGTLNPGAWRAQARAHGWRAGE